MSSPFSLIFLLTLYLAIPSFDTLATFRKKPSEIIVGKGENAGHTFFQFSQCFLPFLKSVLILELQLITNFSISERERENKGERGGY